MVNALHSTFTCYVVVCLCEHVFFFSSSIPITHPISITGLKLNRSIAMVIFSSSRLTVFDLLFEIFAWCHRRIAEKHTPRAHHRQYVLNQMCTD